MKFTFFTLGGNLIWEDIYNYQNWIIQRNIMNQRCRLLDPYNIRRDSGTFEQCKETLLKYIDAFELDDLYDDTIIILHGFGRSKKSVKMIAESLKPLKMNVVALGYPSLRRGTSYHASMLSIFLKNIKSKGKLYIINVGSGCLITRKLLSRSNNYRNYNIARILDINPLNSGSDLAEILSKSSVLNFLLGPMLADISTPKAIAVPHLPEDIEHGIIFSPLTVHDIAGKIISRFDSFPFSTPPSEESYARNIKKIEKASLFPLKNPELMQSCREFIQYGKFSDKENTETTTIPQKAAKLNITKI